MSFLPGTRVVGGASKLISFFIRQRNPRDLFTYQDLSGERTDVYIHSGMTLVEERATKQVLGRSGISHRDATNNRNDWFSIEQAVRRGPDALLGSNLGEVFNAEGKRKTNIELFTEELGYHLETISGDRVYEWANPEYTFYCYRITSSADAGYYIGIHNTPESNASVETCEQDGYWGSGGKLYQQWVKEVRAESLQKEVISKFSSLRAARAFERQLLGDKYTTDPNCKNSIAGGGGSFSSFVTVRILPCAIHGEAKHLGSKCAKCTYAAKLTQAFCAVHGLTEFRSDHCHRCSIATAYTVRVCPIHGESTFKKNTCMSCVSIYTVTTETCAIHGETAFQQGVCSKCRTAAQITIASCKTHGEVKHRKGKCITCYILKSYDGDQCSIHGRTLHYGGSCVKCNGEASRSLSHCNTHGTAIHFGSSCAKCTARKLLSTQLCPGHGETKFRNGKCLLCFNQGLVTEKVCHVHGLAKHRGKTCYRCSAAKRKKPTA